MGVQVVPEVLARTALVSAVDGRSTPCELPRQAREQEEDEEATHEDEC